MIHKAAIGDFASAFVALSSTLMAFLDSNHGGLFFAYAGLAIVSVLLIFCRRDHTQVNGKLAKLMVRVAELETELRLRQEKR